jgi:3-oxoacyl-[acyl-carrier protein] reductase
MSADGGFIMDLGLKGKRALVTGASRGLGYATAALLIQEGARLAINSRNLQAIEDAARNLEAETGSEVFPFAGDVANPEVPDRLIAQAVESLGGLDILITNSGGPPAGKFETFDDQAWQAAVELNLLSHVRLIRAALPHLRASSAASVLTITSYSVKQPIPNLVLSNSVRAATIGLTKTLALELGSEGIRFNSILPAWTETERVYQLMEHRAQTNRTTVEAEFEKQAQDSPLGRMGRPEEFANVAVFLASPAASYVTGVMLSVDGGMVKGTL